MTTDARRSNPRDVRRGGTRLLVAGLSAVLVIACSPPVPAPSGAASAPAADAPPVPAASGAPAAAPAPAPPPAPIPVKVAYAAASAGQAGAYVAYETGLFREQGLDVELVYLSGTLTDQAIITGDTPVGFGANVIATHLSGADIIAVAGAITRPTFTLYVRPGINSPQDLRGKTLLANPPGAANTLATLLVLKHFGLEPNRDVSIQPTPGIVEQVAMLSQGLADGAAIAPPGGLQVEAIGMVPLLKIADLGFPFVQNTVGTTRSYARDNPEIVRRVLRGFVAAVALMRRDPETTKTFIGKYTRTEDPKILDETYQAYRDAWGRPDFRVSPEAVRTVLSVLDVPGADTARPEEFVDNRFIDELHASGYVREVGAE
jgi:NitT/TauT family transport system substrate-binding protein